MAPGLTLSGPAASPASPHLLITGLPSVPGLCPVVSPATGTLHFLRPDCSKLPFLSLRQTLPGLPTGETSRLGACPHHCLPYHLATPPCLFFASQSRCKLPEAGAMSHLLLHALCLHTVGPTCVCSRMDGCMHGISDSSRPGFQIPALAPPVLGSLTLSKLFKASGPWFLGV